MVSDSWFTRVEKNSWKLDLKWSKNQPTSSFPSTTLSLLYGSIQQQHFLVFFTPPPPLCFLACLYAGLDTLILLHGAQRRQARRMTLSSFAFINQQVKIKPAWVPALFYEICFCRRFIWKVKIQSTTLKVHLTKTSASDVTFPWLLLAEGQVSTWVYTEGNQKAGGISAVIALTWCKTESYLWNWRIRMWQDCW